MPPKAMPPPAAPTSAFAAAPSVRAGVALMLLGMLLFSLNDVMGKWLVATYSVGQVLLIRSFAGLVALTPFIWAAGAASLFRIERPGLQALRAALATVEVFCFYAAVQYLPLADAMTYWLAAPIYVAALSPLLLGERVGWRRWCAIAVGFGGVVIAMGPSAAALSPAAVLPLSPPPAAPRRGPPGASGPVQAEARPRTRPRQAGRRSRRCIWHPVPECRRRPPPG